MSQRIRVLQFLLFLYRYANDHQVGAFVLLPLATKILPSVIVTTVITRFNSTGNNYLPNEQGKNENENDGGDGDKPRYRSKLQRLNQATRAGQARARSTKDSNINSVPLNSRKPEAEPDFRETKGRKKKEKQKNEATLQKNERGKQTTDEHHEKRRERARVCSRTGRATSD